jgi:hypothetical protein
MGIGKTPNRDLLPFYRRLGPEFDDFARRGTMLIHKPVGQLLGGFHFDPHYKSARWLYFFVDPLYIPKGFMALSWGWRLPKPPPRRSDGPVLVAGSDEQVEETIRVMRDEGLANLMPILELDGFYEFVRGRPNRLGITEETLAFTATLLGDAERALTHINEGIISLQMSGFWPALGEETVPDETSYDVERRNRLLWLRDILRDGDVQGAVRQLGVWREEVIDRENIRDLVTVG